MSGNITVCTEATSASSFWHDTSEIYDYKKLDMLLFHPTENPVSLWHKPRTVQDSPADSGGREGNARWTMAQSWSYAGSNVAKKVWRAGVNSWVCSLDVSILNYCILSPPEVWDSFKSSSKAWPTVRRMRATQTWFESTWPKPTKWPWKDTTAGWFSSSSRSVQDFIVQRGHGGGRGADACVCSSGGFFHHSVQVRFPEGPLQGSERQGRGLFGENTKIPR